MKAPVNALKISLRHQAGVLAEREGFEPSIPV